MLYACTHTLFIWPSFSFLYESMSSALPGFHFLKALFIFKIGGSEIVHVALFCEKKNTSIRFRIEALLFIIRKGRDDHSSLILLHMIWWVMIEKWTVFFRINYHFYKSGKFNCNMIDFLANVYCGFIYTASIPDMNISRQSTVWQWSSLVNIREYRQPPLVIVLLLKRGGHIYIKWVGY